MLPRKHHFLFVLMSLIGSLAYSDEGVELFEKRIRPLLVEKCLECHGATDPEAGLRLTSRDHLLRGGDHGPAAVERQPDESLLLRAVRRKGKLKMPPEAPLQESEIQALADWIAVGLPWPESEEPSSPKPFRITDVDRQHWAFRPIANPELPAVKQTDWPQTTIDTFVLAKLEAAGIQPTVVADRRTLLRRAYFDLIGLPPTWDEVQAFIHDPDATVVAFARVVDRLLESPAYGERWGRHWLDVARFADTKDGVLMYGDDRIRPYAYTYRDYVIRSLNEDVPFDRFVHEQLAADLITPPVEPWRLAAMGFLTLGRMYDNNIHDVIDDQIDTVGRGLLGMTLACARCHDHKSDPIPTADYYSLYGVFASSEAPLELPVIGSPGTSPDVVEFEQKYAAKREEVRKMLDEQFALLTEATKQRVSDYLVRVATTEPDPMETAIFFLSLAPEDLRPPIVARWRRLIARRAISDDPVFGPWHDLMSLRGKVAQSEFEMAASKIVEHWKSLPAGIDPGQVNPLVRDALMSSTFQGPEEVARCYGDLLRRLYEESKRPIQADTASASLPDPARGQMLSLLVGPEGPGYFPKGHTWRYMSRKEKDQLGGLLKDLDRMAVQFSKAPPRAMVLNDAETPHDPHIFVRGNPSRHGDAVPRQFLTLFSGESHLPFGHGSGRLDLAHRITANDNPLTARVLVNRIWMHHFGEPLVATPSDFGRRTPSPTHPELLDHLASRFMAEGWSLKKLHRWIMTSGVYQQSSSLRSPSEANAQVGNSQRPDDFENRLLGRMNRRRLEFESLRDTMLAISGRLQQQVGGRPVNLAGDPKNQRRTVYGLVDRQSLPDLYRSFDFASPDQSVERRPRTVVPQQALFALNSEFVSDQAKALAARVDAASSGDAERVTTVYQMVYQREPTSEEVTFCNEFLRAKPDGASKLSPWEQFCQVLLVSNETMYID
jgi:hypothetical protein